MKNNNDYKLIEAESLLKNAIMAFGTFSQAALDAAKAAGELKTIMQKLTP